MDLHSFPGIPYLICSPITGQEQFFILIVLVLGPHGWHSGFTPSYLLRHCSWLVWPYWIPWLWNTIRPRPACARQTPYHLYNSSGPKPGAISHCLARSNNWMFLFSCQRQMLIQWLYPPTTLAWHECVTCDFWLWNNPWALRRNNSYTWFMFQKALRLLHGVLR